MVVEDDAQPERARVRDAEVEDLQRRGVRRDVGVDAIAISPDGSSAAIYSFANARIQVVGGLPSSPFVHSQLDASSFEDGLTAIAISRDKQVLAAFNDGDDGSLYLFRADSAPELVARAGAISDIRFATASDDAVVTDRTWNQVPCCKTSRRHRV